MASNSDIMQKSRQVVVAAEMALEYGFTDADGKQPRSIRAEKERG